MRYNPEKQTFTVSIKDIGDPGLGFIERKANCTLKQIQSTISLILSETGDLDTKFNISLGKGDTDIMWRDFTAFDRFAGMLKAYANEQCIQIFISLFLALQDEALTEYFVTDYLLNTYFYADKFYFTVPSTTIIDKKYHHFADNYAPKNNVYLALDCEDEDQSDNLESIQSLLLLLKPIDFLFLRNGTYDKEFSDYLKRIILLQRTL